MEANDNNAQTLIEQLLIPQEVVMAGGCEASQIVADLPYLMRIPPGVTR
ncbi:hypothetical protein NX773_01400 [Massilia solisilvae]|uniref:Uncharacterized protein n=1 Tax=Massilia solisilvae TaxID=1811225 RepID=A0ABT2BE67_9BURK|nr:hypothetical protein [Massilia solisilvae]MCS0606819.1 hypothetical protein [Massilia solisilvae]